MSYFMVFQGKNFEKEMREGYIWAPKHGANGRKVPSWSLLTEIKTGDIVFSVYKRQVVSINTALGAYSSKSKEISEDNYIIGDCNQNSKNCKEGFEVRLEYTPINHISIDEIWNDIKNMLPDEYGPFNKNGGGNQGYLFIITEEMGQYLMNKINRKEDKFTATEPKIPMETFKQFEGEIKQFIIKATSTIQHKYKMLTDDEVKEFKAAYIKNLLDDKTSNIINIDNIPFEDLVRKVFTIGRSRIFILRNWRHFENYFSKINWDRDFVDQSLDLINKVRNRHAAHSDNFATEEEINQCNEYMNIWMNILKQVQKPNRSDRIES